MLSNGRAYPAFFLLRIILVMLVFTTVRGLFFAFNSSAFASFSVQQIAQAFALGMRFDAWIVFVCLMPLFLLELATHASGFAFLRRVTALASGAVLAFVCVMMFFELSDCEYFRFSGSRTTLAIFSMSGDALEQSAQLLLNFWHIPALTVLYSVLLFSCWRVTQHKAQHPRVSLSRRRLWITGFAGVLLGTLAIRGGLQRKPLSPTHAVYLGDSKLAALALNTSFQMVHSSGLGVVKKLQFYNTTAEAARQLDVPRERHAPVSLAGSHVVVLIVESLSSEYMGFQGITRSYAPFLSSLAEKSLYFENAFANGRQSIEALPSIFASLPSLIGEPFITSRYSHVTVPALGSVLSNKGYATAFFHGAKNGSMYIDAMAKKFGFERFFGLSEYPESRRDFDGSWGIFDEPFLNFTVQQLSALPRPFAAGIFTLSSHNPYHIPRGLESRFPADGTPFQRSLSYADFAISRFFAVAEQQDWFKDTLFVITGDHTAELSHDVFKTEQNIYRVPILFYDPSGRLKPKKSSRLIQHADIFPTILDLIGDDSQSLSQSLLPFGQSAFLPSANARIANRSGEWFWYREENSLVRLPLDGQSKIEVWRVDDTNILSKRRGADTHADVDAVPAVDRAKSYLQSYNDGLLQGGF